MIESQQYGGFLFPETQINASSPRRVLSDQHTLPVLWTSRSRSRPQNGSANNRGWEGFEIARKNETTKLVKFDLNLARHYVWGWPGEAPAIGGGAIGLAGGGGWLTPAARAEGGRSAR